MKEVDPWNHFDTFPRIAQADTCQTDTQTLTPRNCNAHGLKIFNDISSPIQYRDQLDMLVLFGIVVIDSVLVKRHNSPTPFDGIKAKYTLSRETIHTSD